MFQDAAGTTAAALEQPVGLVLDKSKGLTLGSTELVTNGGPFTATTDWTGNTATLSVVSGKLRVTSTGLYGRAVYGFSTTIGRWYRFTATAVGVSGTTDNIYIQKTDAAGGTGNPVAAGGGSSRTITIYTVATAATTYISLVNGLASNAVVDWDNISVRELPGNHLSQSTSTARPVLSARVNLLTRTEEFDNAYWNKNNVTASGTSILEQAVTNFHFIERANIAVSANTSHVIQAVLKPNGRNVAEVFFYDGATTRSTIFNLTDAGSKVSDNGSATGTISANEDGSYTCRVTATTVNTSINVGVTLYSNSTTNNYLGDITKGIFIQSIDLRPSNIGVGLPAYQRVGAATSGTSSTGGTADYDTTGFPLYLKFDGTDDFLVSGTISPGSVDKAQVFAGVRRLPSATDYPTICEYSNEFDGAGNSGTFYLGFGAATQNAYGMGMKGSSAISYNPITYTPPITNVASMLMDIGGSSKADELKPYLNGVLEQEGGGGTNAGTGNFGSYPLYVGRRGGTSLPFNGQLYSLILRFSATNMDAATISSTETWVNGKTKAYGPPVEIEILTRDGSTILTRDGSTVIGRSN